MDFEVAYTQQQQRFREEVRAFFEANIPPILRTTHARDGDTYEEFLAQRELGRKLGARGWLYPTAPKEYGGGGLSVDEAVILNEEIDRFNMTLPPYSDSATLAAPTIQVWGTPEQKQRMLPPMYRGEVRTWQLLTEPSAGSDLASVQTRAVKDGDDYVVTGQKIFVGTDYGADQLWTLTVTNPDAPRHENLSWLMIDFKAPGVTVQPMELLTRSDAGGVKNSVFFDQVRVPGDNLVGGEDNGWKVATTHLELEHGGGGRVGTDKLFPRVVEYCKTHLRDDKPIIQHQDARDVLMDYFVESEVQRLFGIRNYWLSHGQRPRSYEGPQLSMWRKWSSVLRSHMLLKLLGYHALTSDPTWSPAEGHVELNHRSAIVGTHPGGTIEVQKLVMARRIGIGRTAREEAGRLE